MTLNVLVADDESYLRNSYQRSFKRAGFEVVLAENGQEAIEVINAGRLFDAIVSDGLMPLVKGHEFITWLRVNRKRFYGNRTPAFALCSGTLDDEMKAAVDLYGVGAQALAKPIDNAVLVEYLRKGIVDKEDLPALLVVDDESAVRDYYREKFVGRYNIGETSSGDEGLKLIRSLQPDLVILDQHIGEGTDGSSVLKRLAADQYKPVVAFCNGDEKDKLEPAMGVYRTAGGRVEAFRKPCDIEELVGYFSAK